MNMNEIVEKRRYEEKLRDNEHFLENRKSILDMKEKQNKFNDKMKGKFVHATNKDYLLWLEGYLKKEGKITHCYDYPMYLKNWIVATKDFEVSPLYGSCSMKIIVPKDIKFLGGEKGHSNLYFMNSFETTGTYVPIYSDTKF